MAEKLIEGVIPPLDKNATNKLELDKGILRLFKGIGKVTVLHRVQPIFLFLNFLDRLNFLKVMVLTSSLSSHGREMRDKTMIQ